MLLLAALLPLASATDYTIDDSRGPARVFDGIGGLSGGGATSVLLPAYPEPQRSTVLDLLFKPNFGASLQILKVEIGGDAQSTDGAESSHMHDPWSPPSFERGYEWWLMKEAKARNPAIKLYGLPWAFPQWVSCEPGTLEGCTGNAYDRPAQTADYIVSWVRGAKEAHGLDIDYVGCWNERAYNKTYLEVLRRSLDAAGFLSTKLIAADSSFNGVAQDVNSDPAFAAALWGLGAHYPNMASGPAAEETGKPLWASEEDSTYNNAVGAGCWARVINQSACSGARPASGQTRNPVSLARPSLPRPPPPHEPPPATTTQTTCAAI
jgi:galactosylceramidase